MASQGIGAVDTRMSTSGSTATSADPSSPYVVTGRVYNDLNGDGMYSPGEALQGVTVSAYSRTVTAADGTYTVGSYTYPSLLTFSGGGLPADVKVELSGGEDAHVVNLINFSTVETWTWLKEISGVSTIIGRGDEMLVLIGGPGENTIIGSSGDDLLSDLGGAHYAKGGDGNDSYFVTHPDDVVDETGTRGIDYVTAYVDFSLSDKAHAKGWFEWLIMRGDGIRGTGNALSNTIWGGGADNILKGLGGNDRISGGKGNDIMQGGAGNDRLTGEHGKDILTGGDGADIFRFTKQSDSTVLVTGRDWIVDFRQSDGDIIDVSGIDADTGLAGNQSFSFIGRGAFTQDAGELRYSVISGRTIVYADTDGDGVADFSVALGTIPPLVATDFIL